MNAKANAGVLKIVGIVNRLNVAPNALRPEIERELVAAARELVSSAPAPAAAPDLSSLAGDFKAALEIHREVLRHTNDEDVIRDTLARIRRLEAHLSMPSRVGGSR